MFRLLKEKAKENLSVDSIARVKSLQTSLVLPFEFLSDFIRYLSYNSTFGAKKDKVKLLALLVKDYHRIEKGMALPKPRPGFGHDVLRRLVKNIEVYIKNYGESSDIYAALNTLSQYLDFSRKSGSPQEWLEVWLNKTMTSLESGAIGEAGGTILVKKIDVIPEISTQGMHGLFYNRYSIRSFTDTPVSYDLIEQAVEFAKKTPSVCNRQSAKIYFVKNDAVKQKVLSLQNGNRGFGDTADLIAVITSDIKCFEGAGERNQPYVDGGLMAMSLCYALHSLGLGTCFLNWSVRSGVDRKLHRLLDISTSEVVVTLMAIGHIPEDLEVAYSPRRSTSSMYEII